MTLNVLDAALRYVPRTIPLYPPNAFPAGDQRNGKAPSVGRDWPTWRASPEAIRGHYARRPSDNVGLRTGGQLVVLDIDPRAGGDDVLADLEHDNAELQATVEVITGGGGRHLYFRSAAPVASFDLGAGVEVKAQGRQVVAPPSLHPTGRRYAFADGCAPGQIGVASLPAWVAAGRAPAPTRTPTDEWLRILAGVHENNRNTSLTRLAGHLLARDVDAHLAAGLVHLVNRQAKPPLPSDEVDRIMNSIAGRETRKRRAGKR